MKDFMIITDTNSGIMQQEANDLGIEVVAMPFNIDGVDYLEGIELSPEIFYEKLISNADIKTSQPSRMYLEEMWDRILKDYEEILYIPTSSGLSGTCDNAKVYAENYKGKVYVVDNLKIAVTLRDSVFYAIELKKQGKSPKEIKDILEANKDKQSNYIMVNDLKYLKRGGRISPAAATFGTILNMKPILTTRGHTFDKTCVTLSVTQAKKKMIQRIKFDLEHEFKEDYENGNMVVSVAHTQNEKEALRFKEEIMQELPKLKFRFVDGMSLSVACHVGVGTIAISISYNDSL